MATQTKLPKLNELHNDAAQAFKNDELNLLLNQPPHESWIKKHPTATVKNDKNETIAARYIPIDKIEYLLTRIFQKWRVEVLREGVMMNSVYVTVRLYYNNPVNGQWDFHDGVGAKDLQLDAGSRASDMAAIKSAAVMMALPSAKSYAIKDAAEHLGSLFGRDLNRRNIIQFSGSYMTEPPPQAQINTAQKQQAGSEQGQQVDFEM